MVGPGRDRPSAEAELEVGRVVGAHGIRGGLRVELYDAASTSLRAGVEVHLRTQLGQPLRRFTLERVAPKPGSRVIRVWLDGVEDRAAADKLRDAQVWVAREHLPPLDPDEYYLADAVGSRVLEHGRELGTIVGVTTNNAQDLFEVEWTGATGKPRRWLCPVLPGFVVSIDDQGVHVELPAGLLPAELERGRPR